MPRTELGRTIGDPGRRVNPPGGESGRRPTPPESILDKIPVLQGPPGEKGDKGDPGEPGEGAEAMLPIRVVLDEELATWPIHHGRGVYPIVSLRDENGPMIARYDHIDADNVVVSFPSPRIGVTADLIF